MTLINKLGSTGLIKRKYLELGIKQHRELVLLYFLLALIPLATVRTG
jgi:hypothetical protein